MTPQTDRETLLEIAELLDQCKMLQDFGQVWVRLFAEVAMEYRDKLRAIAGRMGDGCDINLHIGTVPQGEPETYRARKTGYDNKTGTYTFTIVEGEATNEQA